MWSLTNFRSLITNRRSVCNLSSTSNLLKCGYFGLEKVFLPSISIGVKNKCIFIFNFGQIVKNM